MAQFTVFLWITTWVLHFVHGEDKTSHLPSWILENPGFQHPIEINSIEVGNGSIVSKKRENLGWLIHLNEKKGYGVEIELQKLSVNPDSDNYVLIAGWPLATKNFKEIKLFTGNFQESRRMRLPDSKTFFVLYSAAESYKNSEIHLTYKRYGVTYEKKTPSTERPVKKETLYEIQFKGRGLDDYFDVEFMGKFKEAVRAIAKKYCFLQKISFDDTIPTNKMVLINRISFCPFEWPDRDICVSLQHSVFVSGTKLPDGIVMDYELTADHLKQMWMQSDHPEIEEIGIKVFKLPNTSVTIFWWTFVLGMVVVVSLVGILVFWKIENYSKDFGFKEDPTEFKISKRKKIPKLKLAQNQSVPSFMFQNNMFDSQKFEEAALKSNNKEIICNEDETKFTNGSPVQIKSYIGSFLFNSNKAFEDEEETVAEFRPK